MTARDEAGYVTPSFVGVVGLTMLLLVLVANVLLVRYAEGVMQAAVEAGARRGVATGSAEECVGRVQQVLDSGLGALASTTGTPACGLGPEGAVAQVDAVLAGWVPLVPDQPASATARAAVRPAGP